MNGNAGVKKNKALNFRHKKDFGKEIQKERFIVRGFYLDLLYYTPFSGCSIHYLHQGIEGFRKKCFKGGCTYPDFYISCMGDLFKTHSYSCLTRSSSSKNGIISMWMLWRYLTWWT